MGFFSRFFAKPEPTLWSKFENQPNDKTTLHEKANVLTPLLIRMSQDHTKSIKEQILTDGDEDLIFAECLAIYLHLMDRVAFDILGAQKRSWFVDSLLEGVLGHLDVVTHNPEMRGAFVRHYNERAALYASCEFVAQPKESGGYGIRQTVGWKLAECLGVDDLTEQMSLITNVAYFSTNFMEKLQIRRFLNGSA